MALICSTIESQTMKPHFKILDTFQIVGFILSALISVALLLTRQDTFASITLGLVLAGLTQLFDLQVRLSQSEERLLQANALSQKLYHDDWLLSQIREIVSSYQAVKDSWFELFRGRAEYAITEAHSVLHLLAEGYMLVHLESPFSMLGGAYSVGAGMFENIEKSWKEVVVGDVTYWRSAAAEKYAETNARATKRGVKFTRIFLQPMPKLHEIGDILKKQQEQGIEVYVAQAELLPRELIEDYAILDDRILLQLQLDPSGEGREEKISIDPMEVERMVNRFNVLLGRYVQRLDDAIGILKQ